MSEVTTEHVTLVTWKVTLANDQFMNDDFKLSVSSLKAWNSTVLELVS